MKKLITLIISLVLMTSAGLVTVSAAEEEVVIFSTKNDFESLSEEIDRLETTYCLGGANDWGYINGDNNWFTETVRVVNCSNGSIRIRAYMSDGTQIGSAQILDASGTYASTTFYIPYNAGTYYFKVQFTNYSTGWITVMLTTV